MLGVLGIVVRHPCDSEQAPAPRPRRLPIARSRRPLPVAPRRCLGCGGILRPGAQRFVEPLHPRLLQPCCLVHWPLRWTHRVWTRSGDERSHGNTRGEAPLHGEFREAGCAGGAARARDGAGDRGALRGAPERGERLKAAGGGRSRQGVRATRIEARRGVRGDDPEPAREHQRADGGAGVSFCASWSAEQCGATRAGGRPVPVVAVVAVRTARY